MLPQGHLELGLLVKAPCVPLEGSDPVLFGALPFIRQNFSLMELVVCDFWDQILR